MSANSSASSSIVIGAASSSTCDQQPASAALIVSCHSGILGVQKLDLASAQRGGSNTMLAFAFEACRFRKASASAAGTPVPGTSSSDMRDIC